MVLEPETFELWCPDHADLDADDKDFSPTFVSRPRRQTAGSHSRRMRASSDAARPRTDWQRRDDVTWVKVVPPWWCEQKTVHFACEWAGRGAGWGADGCVDAGLGVFGGELGAGHLGRWVHPAHSRSSLQPRHISSMPSVTTLLHMILILPTWPAARVFKELFQCAASVTIVDEAGMERQCTIQAGARPTAAAAHFLPPTPPIGCLLH